MPESSVGMSWGGRWVGRELRVDGGAKPDANKGAQGRPYLWEAAQALRAWLILSFRVAVHACQPRRHAPCMRDFDVSWSCPLAVPLPRGGYGLLLERGNSLRLCG